MSSIKNIIFDFGNILINLNFKETDQRFINLSGKKIVEKSRIILEKKGIFQDYERGKFSEKVFLQEIREASNDFLSTDEQLHHAWVGMLQDIPKKRIEMLKELKKNYGIYMLSNINHTHATYIHEYLLREHGISEIEWRNYFDKMYYSHEIGERKPDTAAFHYVLNDAKLRPEECLFIDDLKENTDVAAQLGIQTYTHEPTNEIADIIHTLLKPTSC